jgi:hypothetical protein
MVRSSLPLVPALLLLLGVALGLPALAQDGPPRPSGPPWARTDIASSHTLHFGSAVLQVDFASGSLDLGTDAVLQHIQSAASAVTTYYGRFPVDRARILVVPAPGRSGVFHGTTWPSRGGFQGFTRINIGEHTSAADLADDWMMTHEMVHMGFPSLPDDQHWMEEGLATYIEPLARVMTGELPARRVWRDMVRDMPKGEPQPGDRGIDNTHTWGRTYWGGALFCLVADVQIRRETHDRKGLRDALQAIVAQGGTIDHDWPLDHALAIGDRATGTTVLTRLYSSWKDSPVPVDLDKIWSDLGVRLKGDELEFIPNAPLAMVRDSIAPEPVQAKRAATSGL